MVLIAKHDVIIEEAAPHGAAATDMFLAAFSPDCL
jgi:hypothetical protein